jgi:hypothetical protein
MSLVELKQEIKSLTRLEKLQLIANITRMLQEEESEFVQYFPPGTIAAVWSPFDEYAAAAKLQELLEYEK